MGPPLLTPRCRHSSCAIQSDDGSRKCIIIIGGWTGQEKILTSTEILYLAAQNWVQGPDLPVRVKSAACVALPSTSNFACVVIGGSSEESAGLFGINALISSNVYGLDKNLSGWTFLDKISTSRAFHIALPIS